MNKPINISRKPSLGDDRYRKLRHKELLDPLRIIHFNHYGIDPSIQHIQSNDGHSTMFENGRFLPTSWYLVRGKTSYKIQFSHSRNDNFTGSILVSSEIQNPFDDNHTFSFLDNDYISSLTGYINEICKGHINLILSDSALKTISFGHISLPSTRKGEYFDFIDCATEQISDRTRSRNIIYVGDDLKDHFTSDEIQGGERIIERGKDEVEHLNHISRIELEEFNETVKQKILRF